MHVSTQDQPRMLHAYKFSNGHHSINMDPAPVSAYSGDAMTGIIRYENPSAVLPWS